MTHARVVVQSITSRSDQVRGVKGTASISISSSDSRSQIVQQTITVKTSSQVEPPSTQS